VRFSTSITPVREALRQLHAEGLLVGEPHRGVAVASPDLEQITSIYVLRRLIEPFAARRAARRLSRLDFDRAYALNAQFAEAQKAGDERAARRLNREFHWVFYEACGLPTLVGEIERLWAAFPWAALQVRKTHAVASYTEHEKMLEAIVADDQPLIESLFEQHITNGYLALVEDLGAKATDPFDIT
jgi:DNA-binding GntR family transcriptional regulator